MPKKLKSIILPIVSLVLLLTLTLTNFLKTPDLMLCDKLYNRKSPLMRDIKIIAIDEKTLKEYGKLELWSRDKIADTLNVLFSNENAKPSIVGIDVMFIGNSSPEVDEKLALACKKGKIVTGSNIVYRGSAKKDNKNNLYYDSWNIDMIEQPFAELKAVSEAGFTNAYIGKDGYIRYTKLEEDFDGESYPSFASLIARLYLEENGKSLAYPKTTKNGQLNFFYSSKVGEFPHFSLVDVVDGKIPLSEFKDSIVIIGAYAPGLQDSYANASQHGKMMYGCEIQANIIEALVEGKTAIPASMALYCLVAGLVILAFFFLAQGQALVPVSVEGVALILIHLFLGRYISIKGYTIPQLPFVILIAVGIIYFVVVKYFAEKIKKKRLLASFKTYVAPQVVDVLSKDDSFSARLGGEKRHVAVLFVDIRGFTPLSESLSPEQVVSVLNEYLALTTDCILKNEGMLDKFIGDATMAVFNAPADLDDYIFRAVKTAVDMRKGADALAEKLFELCGKRVAFGIGVNCGEAVVGNIGCKFRMDYTAIGDTVNTASRLESNAKPNEILISRAVYDSLKDRIDAEFVGELKLKGKSEGFEAYRVISIKETENE